MVDDVSLPLPKKMLKLTVVLKARDSFHGKNDVEVLLSLYKQIGIAGATVVHGARGYGLRGVARADILGLSVDLPTIVMTVSDREKIEQVLPEVHRMLGTNGLITTEEVNVY